MVSPVAIASSNAAVKGSKSYNEMATKARVGLGEPKGMLGAPSPHAQTGLPVWV